MIVGVLKEIKAEENRVCMTPAGVEIMLQNGHTVLVEKNAGKGSGFNNRAYSEAGAEIVDTPAEIFKRAKMVKKYANNRAELKAIIGEVNKSDEERMEALIGILNDYVEHYHGGSIELVGFDGQQLLVKMGGACVGCDLAPHLLDGWIADTVRPFFPELEQVEAVE